MWKLPTGNFIPGRFSPVKRFKRFVREFFTTRRGLAVVPLRGWGGVAVERLEGAALRLNGCIATAGQRRGRCPC